MIKDKKTTIGYHCPFCGASILNGVDIFTMSNKLLKLKCICGESELILQITKENKVRITVPCIICPVTHSFTLSSTTFFDKDLFFLTCTFTAIGICFFGRSDKVINAMKNNEEELIQMFKAYDEYNDEDEHVYTSGFTKINVEDEENGENFKNDIMVENKENFDDFFIDDEDEDEDDDYLDDFDDDLYSFDDYKFINENNGEELDWDNLINDLMGISKDGYLTRKSNKENQGFEIYRSKDKEDENADEIKIDAEEKILLDKIKIKSPAIFEQILSIIYKLIEDKHVYCFCERLEDFKGSITIKEDKIILECKNCGSKREIKAKTPADLEYFYDIDALYLDME